MTKPWRTGREIVNDSGKTIHELFDYMKKGLQGYTESHDKIVDSDFLLPVRRKLLAELKEEVRRECASPDAIPLSESEKAYSVQCRYDGITGGLFDHPIGYALMSFNEMVNNSLSKVWDFQFKTVDVDEFFASEYSQNHLPSYEEIQKEKERKAWDSIKDRSVSEEIQKETYESLLQSEMQSLIRDFRLKIREDFEKNQNGTTDEETQAEAADSFLNIALDNRQLIADLAGSVGTESEREKQKAYLISLLAGSEEVLNVINEYNQSHPLSEAEDSLQTQEVGPASAASPDGNTIVRRSQALTVANIVKRDSPHLTVKEAAKEINVLLARIEAFDKDGKPLMQGYNVKHLMRIIKPLGFKSGKPGKIPKK
jgi:hypothetical protein